MTGKYVTHRLIFVAVSSALVHLPISSGAATRGVAYVASYSERAIYRVDYTYADNQTLTIDATKRIASVPNEISYGLSMARDHHLVSAGGGTVQRINPGSGLVEEVSPHNNANTLTIDPVNATAWAGWKDTPISSVPLQPFGDGTPHTVVGDDTIATEIAFTAQNGVFYTTGGEDRNGNVGQINLTTFTTTRWFSGLEATGIKYDPYSRTIIFAAFGHAHQFDPAVGASLVSSRDDTSYGDHYIDVSPDGEGHLLATWSTPSASTLVLIDYSTSGRIGDGTSRHSSALIPISSSIIVTSDFSLFADGFDP